MLTGKTIGQLTLLETLTPNTLFPVELDGDTYHAAYSSFTSNSGGVIEVTYSELVDKITGESLSSGGYYLITDFQTCYDVPEYYVNGQPKGMGSIDYRQGNVEPILVLATSINTISSTAYQPAHPNDRIQYDWTFNSTLVSGNTAYGRITERIDEFNNRTDYDHRNISFNRFQSYNRGTQLTGTIVNLVWSQSRLMGNGTSFLSQVNPGDILLIDGYQTGGIGVKVVSVTTDNELIIVTDPTFGGIPFCGETYSFYSAQSTGNYGEYKEVYVGQKNQEDWVDVLTFNLNGSAVHNYIGDYSKFYLQEIGDNSGFLLANNVFFSENSSIYSNTIGDMSYNNNFTYYFQKNTIGEAFHDNVGSQYSFVDNIIGNNFNDNRIMNQVSSNVFSDRFYGNIIISSFNNNEIGTYSYGNEFYSDFYDNKIGSEFYSNVIGDDGNLDNFEFYRNRIGNNFNNNIIRQRFQNNQIANEFNNNTVNGNFYKNVIGNGFKYNQNIGYDFYGNHIGNGFNNNDLIGDYFHDNQIGEYFNNNSISYFFNNNQIGNQFENNTLGDTQYFNWDNTSIENLTGRTYNTFYNSLFGDEGENIDNVILGKELIMHDTVNDEYHKVKFTQWTQNGNGGGFSYERTKVYPTVEPTVYFTKTNYIASTDVIVEGSLEITRNDNNGGIYNAAVEGNFNNNVSPTNTQWNSIYTQEYSNNGKNFLDNKISSQFKANLIYNQFSINEVGLHFYANEITGDTIGNKIGSYTFFNNFFGGLFGNSWGGNFYENNVGDGFVGNSFYGEISYNSIGYGFQTNQIGANFNNNIIGDNFGYGYSAPQGNKIGNNFSDNNIGEYFYNNSIPDNFYNNRIGNYFQWNNINTNISVTDFTLNYGNITGFSYSSTGTTAANPSTTEVGGVTNGNGVGAEFTITSDSGTIVGVDLTNYGKSYLVNDTITILGTQIGGQTPDDDIIITVTGVTPATLFYDDYTKQIFERKGGNKRVSYYDENDILNVDSIYTSSGYLDIYSQSLTFPIPAASFEYWCDGEPISNGTTTNQTVNNMTELVALFNNQMGIPTFFDNNDGTLGLYIEPSAKNQLCPTGTLTINVYID